MPDKNSLHEDTHLKVLRLLEATPQINQRDLAQALAAFPQEPAARVEAAVSESIQIILAIHGGSGFGDGFVEVE